MPRCARSLAGVVAGLGDPWWSGTGKGVGAAQGVGYPEPASHVLDQAGGVGGAHSGGSDEHRACGVSAPDEDGMGG